MTIHTLPAPCWVLQWAGHPVTDRGAHYDTREAALEASTTESGGPRARHTYKDCGGVVVFGLGAYCILCEDESLGDGDWELRAAAPARLPFLCWVFGCDCGECDPGEYYDINGDGYEAHESTEDDACALAWRSGWWVTPDGHAYHDTPAVPPGTVLASRPVQAGTGQLPLDPPQ